MIFLPQATCIDAALYVYFMIWRSIGMLNDSTIRFCWKLAKDKDASSVRILVCFMGFWGSQVDTHTHHTVYNHNLFFRDNKFG